MSVTDYHHKQAAYFNLCEAAKHRLITDLHFRSELDFDFKVGEWTITFTADQASTGATYGSLFTVSDAKGTTETFSIGGGGSPRKLLTGLRLSGLLVDGPQLLERLNEEIQAKITPPAPVTTAKARKRV